MIACYNFREVKIQERSRSGNFLNYFVAFVSVVFKHESHCWTVTFISLQGLLEFPFLIWLPPPFKHPSLKSFMKCNFLAFAVYLGSDDFSSCFFLLVKSITIFLLDCIIKSSMFRKSLMVWINMFNKLKLDDFWFNSTHWQV